MTNLQKEIMTTIGNKTNDSEIISAVIELISNTNSGISKFSNTNVINNVRGNSIDTIHNPQSIDGVNISTIITDRNDERSVVMIEAVKDDKLVYSINTLNSTISNYIYGVNSNIKLWGKNPDKELSMQVVETSLITKDEITNKIIDKYVFVDNDMKMIVQRIDSINHNDKISIDIYNNKDHCIYEQGQFGICTYKYNSDGTIIEKINSCIN